MKRLDPHIHAGASSCSRLTDAELVSFFLKNTEYGLIVSDHMSMAFYSRFVGPGKTFRDDEVLYAMEITTDKPWTDLLLISYDKAALESFKPFIHRAGRMFNPTPPLELLKDPRLVIIWAHPEDLFPAWLQGVPVDFLEFNSTHMSLSGMGEDMAGRVVQNYHDRFFPDAGFIVGSDSHQSWTVGRTYIEFDQEVGSGKEAWQALKDGKFTCHYPAQYGYREWTFRPTAKRPVDLRGTKQYKPADFWRTRVDDDAPTILDDIDAQLDGWPEDDYPDNSLAQLLAEADALEAKRANPVLGEEGGAGNGKKKHARKRVTA